MLLNVSPRQHHILEQLLENRIGLSIDALAKALDISRAQSSSILLALRETDILKKTHLIKPPDDP